MATREQDLNKVHALLYLLGEYCFNATNRKTNGHILQALTILRLIKPQSIEYLNVIFERTEVKYRPIMVGHFIISCPCCNSIPFKEIPYTAVITLIEDAIAEIYHTNMKILFIRVELDLLPHEDPFYRNSEPPSFKPLDWASLK